jgi:RNA polymerase sigma-70 factor (ECF subfamily)
MGANEAKHNLLRGAQFTTTHWSVVTAAGMSDSPEVADALEKLCRAYWYPLYAYVRRQSHSPEDAEDLTQQFFSRMLEKNYFANAVARAGEVSHLSAGVNEKFFGE